MSPGGHFFSHPKRASFMQIGPQNRARTLYLGQYKPPRLYSLVPRPKARPTMAGHRYLAPAGPWPREGRAARPLGAGPKGSAPSHVVRAQGRGTTGCKRGGLYWPAGSVWARFWGPNCMTGARFGREKKWPPGDIFLGKTLFLVFFSKKMPSGGHFFSHPKRASLMQIGP